MGRRRPRRRAAPLAPPSPTRSQRLRTAAEVPLEVELGRSASVPVYQAIAARVAEMHAGGISLRAIAENFGVDDHTAAKALRWFRER